MKKRNLKDHGEENFPELVTGDFGDLFLQDSRTTGVDGELGED